MMDINRQIAIITGWTWQTCPALHGIQKEHWHLPNGECHYVNSCPRFLAPENLHRLWAVFLTVFSDKDWSLTYDRHVKDYAITWNGCDTVANGSATLSEALAEAIIEASE